MQPWITLVVVDLPTQVTQVAHTAIRLSYAGDTFKELQLRKNVAFPHSR